MERPKHSPSSSTDGFFQEAPVLRNQFLEDAALRSAFNLFLPPPTKANLAADLHRLGSLVLSPAIQQHLASAEQHLPTLQTWDTFGRRVDRLITSEGWRALQATGQREGIVAIAHEEQHSPHRRLYQFLKYHIWSPSSAITTCPAAMTDGAAALLTRLLRRDDQKIASPETRPVLEEARKRLISRDPDYAWTSGQWMTERTGGSDVQNTETRATFTPDALPNTVLGATASDGSPLGPWRIDGFKWFSSATDANMAVLLAKTGQTDQLSLFFAPTRLRMPSAGADPAATSTTIYNGILPQRLKSKLGTRALPTAELILNNMRAHMLGPPGSGTREVATVLNITRIHNAVSSVASLGRGLAISRAFARVRKVSGGKLLMDVPAHVRGMTEDVEAGASSSSPSTTNTQQQSSVLHPPTQLASPLLRLLTPVLKATTALTSISGLRASLESLGGIGYLEDPADPLLNIARLFRDANVLAIWEGTTDVLGADVVRVLVGGRGGEDGGGVLGVLGAWVGNAVAGWDGKWARGAGEVIKSRLGELVEFVREASAKREGSGELLYHARDIMRRLAWIVASVLLVENARRKPNTGDDTVAGEIARRWIFCCCPSSRGGDARARDDEAETRDWRADAAWDRRIVFEDQEVELGDDGGEKRNRQNRKCARL